MNKTKSQPSRGKQKWWRAEKVARSKSRRGVANLGVKQLAREEGKEVSGPQLKDNPNMGIRCIDSQMHEDVNSGEKLSSTAESRVKRLSPLQHLTQTRDGQRSVNKQKVLKTKD